MKKRIRCGYVRRSVATVRVRRKCERLRGRHDCGVMRIHVPNDREVVYPKILQLSNDSHLYKEDILTGYHNIFKI